MLYCNVLNMGQLVFYNKRKQRKQKKVKPKLFFVPEL